MLAAGEEVTNEEEDEEESAPPLGSLKQVELGVGPQQVEPDTGATEVVVESGEKVARVEDIPGD